MKARTILLAGAVALCMIVAQEPCAQAQTAKAASPAPALKDGWEEIDERLIFLMVRLANVEASLDAVEAVISKTSGKRSARVADAKRAEKGNEMMDRKGGGPMRWPEFYGRTAEKFFYHPVDASTTYHTVTVLSQQSPQSDNQTADGVPSRQGLPVHQRPPQFDYIYRANRDAKARAEREAAELSNKVEALLARRASLETEQTALWCEIAFRAVSRHDLARKPLYRFERASASSATIDRERAEAMKAAANFVRAAMAVIADAQRDQAKAFDSVKQDVADARETLGDAWIRPTFLAAESTDVKAPAGKFAALAKRLENVASNLSDSYTVAIDADRFKDEQRKDVFRSLLQQSLVSYAQIVLALDEMAGALAAEWKLKPDVGKPLIAASRPRAVPAPSPGNDVTSVSSTLPRSSLVLYHQFEELVASGEKESRVANFGSNQEASTAKHCTLATGQFGRAVAMNGKDSHIATKVPWRSAATVSLWVRVRDASQQYYLLDTCDGSGAFSVQRWAPQLFTISLHARGQWESRTVSHGISENKWHHVAVVLNHSADEARYFVDGQLAGKADLQLRNGTWNGNLMISSPFLEKALPGDVDDFAIFDRQLDENQVRQIFRSGQQRANLAELLGLSTDKREVSPSNNATRQAPPKRTTWFPSPIMTMPFDGGSGTVSPTRTWTGDTTEYARKFIASVQDIRLVEGYRGNGLSFNGRSSVMRTNVPLADARSVAFWLRVRSFNEPFRLLSSHEARGAAFGVSCGLYGLVRTRKLALEWGASEQWKYATFDHGLTEGQWHHLIFSFDWTSGTLIYAVDGQPVEPIKFTPPTQPFSGKLTLSNEYEDAALDGEVDDFQVSSAILTPDAIRVIWQNSQP